MNRIRSKHAALHQNPGFCHPKTPLCPHRVQRPLFSRFPIVDECLSGPFRLSHALHTQSHDQHPDVLIFAGGHARAWIRAFHLVAHLTLRVVWGIAHQGFLVPLHGISPTLRSLSITFESISPSEFLNLVCSFPSLEDLALSSRIHGEPDGWPFPPPRQNSPGTFT